ncbi:MAG: DHH family phosphoesterase [Treponema sp.]
MKKLEQRQIDSFREFIDTHNLFFVAGHKEPDGDCISSCLGIAGILKHFGKEHLLLSAGPFKRTEIQEFAPLFLPEPPFLSENEMKNAGLIICDCSEIARLGDFSESLKTLDVFVIDHHKTASCPDGAQSIVDSSAPAACALVQSLYENLAGAPPKEVAEILFFGLMTDTGFFRFLTNADADIFEAASRLVKAGADPRKTHGKITGGKAWSTRKLLGLTLERAERHLDGKLIVTYETQDDTRKWGQEGRDTDALYSALLCLKGVQAVVFVRQETDVSCTIGFRSNDSADVSAVAQKFGGGGHKNAAGCSTNGRLETLIPSIIKEFARIL